MGWKHRLLSKDVESMRGECEACGPIDLLLKSGGVRCGNAVREQRASPNRATHRTRVGHGWGDRPQPHGLTVAEAQAEREGKCCEICGSTKDLNVDHCHATKRRRGVLCNKHNRALGLFGDSVEYLAAAIEYLQKGTPAGGR